MKNGQKHAFDKVQSNVFADNYEEKTVNLGKIISVFNHSCNPNALPYDASVKLSEEYNYKFIFVYAIKAIRSGEEVTIRYSSKFGHEAVLNGFTCDCKRSLTEREKIEEVIKKIKKEITKRDVSIDERDSYIKAYLLSDRFTDVAFNQYWANKGYYASEGDLAIVTKRVANYLGVDANFPLIGPMIAKRSQELKKEIKELQLLHQAQIFES